MKQPYKYWTKKDLENHLRAQALEHGIDTSLVISAVYDKRWNPIKDYNGCNFVQDNLHPFLPCFIHDWRWVCMDYKKWFDLEFRDNLIKFGFKKWKAELYYIMVRCGWLFYYRFKKKND